VQLKLSFVGVHEYELAPLAFNVTLPPMQMPGEAGVTDTVGVGKTVMVMVPVFLQPFRSVPVTV